MTFKVPFLNLMTLGCNLRCPFCQNHEISMAGETEIQTVEVSPAQLAGKAAELRARGNIGVAYTYNEPLVSYEYVRDCAELVHEQRMVNVLVTNGTVEEGPWRALLSLIDAANIDLKGFTPHGIDNWAETWRPSSDPSLWRRSSAMWR